MKTSEIPPIKPLEGNLGHYAQQNNQQYAKTQKLQSDQSQTDKIATPSLNNIHYNKLQNTAKSHDIAQQIRNTQETISAIDTNLAKMQSALESVVKIYPPYPPGSSERIDALRQFSAIRNMIDQLASPPTNKSAKFAHLEKESVNKPLSIDHYHMHAGKGGLDIPDLDSNSSDQQIRSTIEKIAAAHKTVGSRQQAFVSYANGLIAQIN